MLFSRISIPLNPISIFLISNFISFYSLGFRYLSYVRSNIPFFPIPIIIIRCIRTWPLCKHLLPSLPGGTHPSSQCDGFQERIRTERGKHLLPPLLGGTHPSSQCDGFQERIRTERVKPGVMATISEPAHTNLCKHSGSEQ